MRRELKLSRPTDSSDRLDIVHSPAVAGLARLSVTWAERDPAISEPNVPAWAVPAVGCQDAYDGDRLNQLFAECLPFSPRGLVSMVEPAEVTAEQAADDAALAAALGRSGFLVLILARPSWPQVPVIPHSRLVRLSANVFVWSRHDDFIFLQSNIAPNDPVYAPMLLMGRTFGQEAQLDVPAVRNAGSRVYVVGQRDQPWAEEEGSPSSSDGAFLTWAACETALEGVVLRSEAAAARMSAMTHCKPRVRLVKPSLTDKRFRGMAVADVEAAQIAAVLSEDALTGQEANRQRVMTQYVATLVHQRTESMALSLAKTAKAATPALAASVPRREPAPVSVTPDIPADGRPIPVHRDVCETSHSMILAQWLARCMPGRRGWFVMSLTIPWDMMLFQRPQHMARAMAEGERMLVLYLTYARGRRRIDAVDGSPGVFVADGMDLIGMQGAVVSLYSTMVNSALYGVRQVEDQGSTAVYEYIDAIDESITGAVASLADMRRGRDISSACASVVAYSAHTLLEDLMSPRQGAEQVFVPNGVHLPQYDVADNAPVPSQVRGIVQSGRPIVGYFGAVAGWIWTELIADVAKAVPEAEFVIIGPPYPPVQLPEPSDLPPNLRYIGALPATELVLHAKHWSVGIIPFRHGDVARTTSPLKLFEYFAMGLPVVVTDSMGECTRFKEVRRAHDAEGFAEQVREGIRDSKRPEARAVMRRLGEENSWESRAEVMLAAATRTIRKRLSA